MHLVQSQFSVAKLLALIYMCTYLSPYAKTCLPMSSAATICILQSEQNIQAHQMKMKENLFNKGHNSVLWILGSLKWQT